MDLEEHVVGGRYVVKRRLQSGYFGVTWLARDRHIGIDICLKTFFSESPSQRKELVILKKLCEGHFEHDYLCKVFDVSIDRVPVVSPSGHIAGNIQYVVFEYCCGSDLFNFLCTGPWEKVGKVSNFSEPIARHYFKQVVLGVMYLHERGVYHRDIKPENCVLDDNLNLKLTDFGTNKFLSADPMQLLRTKTRGVGTESYRAPEVNSGRGYDPAAADVWSLGVMLFFFVGVEQMFNKVQFLDAYSKQILAPLGIFFPFPLHCSKLDSYLRRDHELKARGVNGSLRGKSLNNELFWQEWATIRDFISSDLFDLFNRIFLLEPSLRITIRDILRHSWMNVTDGMSPEIVKSDMERRCPSDIRMSRDASPRVMGSKVLGGVDQVVLRESLSGASRDDIQFPEDSETWPWLLQLQHLESIQLLLLGSDIQELIMDLQLARKLLDDVLTHPTSEDHRTVFISHINADWIAQLLLVLGFLPQGHTLFLLDEYLNLSFLGAAITFLQGVELAVTRSIIETTCGEEDEDTEEDDVMEMEGIPLEEQVDGSAISVFRPPVFEGGSQGESTASESTSMPQYCRSISGVVEELPNSMDTPMGSQGSGVWTMSTQSSQDEVPESLQLIHDWSADFSRDHKLIELATPLQVLTPKQYKAASEFCKMSGLLCSYGLYQVRTELY